MTISHFSPKWPCLHDCGVNLLEGLPYYCTRVNRIPPLPHLPPLFTWGGSRRGLNLHMDIHPAYRCPQVLTSQKPNLWQKKKRYFVFSKCNFAGPSTTKTACIFARAKNARAVKRTFWSECENRVWEWGKLRLALTKEVWSSRVSLENLTPALRAWKAYFERKNRLFWSLTDACL